MHYITNVGWIGQCKYINKTKVIHCFSLVNKHNLNFLLKYVAFLSATKKNLNEFHDNELFSVLNWLWFFL